MASVDFYSDLSMDVYAGLVTSSTAGAVLKADIVSECGTYSTDANFILAQSLLIGVYDFFILFGGMSVIRSSSFI